MTTAISHSKPTLDRRDFAAVEQTLATGMIADGSLRQSFEKAMASRLGMTTALATSSGTEALTASLLAVGVAPGDEVIMPTYVCDAVAVAIRAAGATPVLCDVEADRCISRACIERRFTARTRAIVVVHPFGAVADVPPIKALGVAVIEDCCQAFGASRDGRAAGTVGDACVLSFHATKLLTTGEGGMALARTPAAADRLERMRRGRDGIDGFQAPPLADVQAALGLSQLARYDSFIERRSALARFYFSSMQDLAIGLPVDVAERSIFFRFPLRSPLPFDEVRRAFDARGIQVRRGVDRLVHDASRADEFPMAEQLFIETVSLPIYPSLTDDDAARVAGAARQVFGER